MSKVNLLTVGQMYRVYYGVQVELSPSKRLTLAANDLVVLLEQESLSDQEQTGYYSFKVLTACGNVGKVWYYSNPSSKPPFVEV